MALFTQYAKPGVYTSVTQQASGGNLFNNSRIMVLIGEGTEEISYNGVELHRGSSATSDDRQTLESLSAQANGTNKVFQTTYFPIVDGTGFGVVTNDVTKVKVLVNGVAVQPTSMNGQTGQISLPVAYALGTDITVSYWFKRKDTLITKEDLTYQIPKFATLSTQSGNLVLGLSKPGFAGNEVSVAFTNTLSNPKPDAGAVTGQGTNAISIELVKTAVPTITFSGGGATTQATAVVTTVAGGAITGVNLVTGGSGYTGLPTVTITGTGSGAVLTPTVVGGVVTALAITNGGSNYTPTYVRKISDIITLINAGIITAQGNLTVVSSASTSTTGAAAAAAFFTGGQGQATNTVFTVKNVPIVDGTNGGVVSNNPANVTVYVNNLPVTVTAVDGLNGLVTLASAVPSTATLAVTYYTNTYQDTFDNLPANAVDNIISVGYGPNRNDFINGIDYVQIGNTISWGNSTTTEAGLSTPGFTPFNATYVTTSLVDDKIYFEQAVGTVNSINNVFTVSNAMTDGSGTGKVTNNPVYVSVYVGTTPVTALAAGPVAVTSISGASKTVTLYDAPAAGNVYVTYWKNRLADNQFTLKVATADVAGIGSYTITDKNDLVLPSIIPGAYSVADSNFNVAGGIIWPNSFSDLKAPAGSKDETITLTFQNTGEQIVLSPATQATNTTAQPGITFTTTSTGTLANNVTIQFVNTTPTADATAISVVGDAITVQIQNVGPVTRTLQQIVSLFATYPPTTTDGGIITATLTGTGSNLATTSAVSSFTGGTNATIKNFSTKYAVTSSLGATGTGQSGNFGYLGETYQDPLTAVTFTIVDPNHALSYGYTTPPTSYYFAAGDTLTFVVSSTTAWKAAVAPSVAIPGLRTTIGSTLGMNVGDTAIVNTYNKAGNEPSVGTFYYVNFTSAKQPADMALKLYTNLQDVYAAYGAPSVANRVSLAAQLAVENGAPSIGIIQVKKVPGTNYAADQTFIDAIATLSAPIFGTTKASVIVPLSTSPTVQQYLNSFLTKQASPRMKGEAIGFVGFATGTTISQAISSVSSIVSNRVIAIMPDGANIDIVDQYGNSSTYAVGGEFLAAAMGGMSLDPSIDVATTLTNRQMVGFGTLLTKFDDPTMDLAAPYGITFLVDNNGSFLVRHYLSTDQSNAINAEPTSTTVVDAVRQKTRSVLQQFIGKKNLGSVVNDISVVMNGMLQSFVQQDILTGYKDLIVTRDAVDPTLVNVSVAIKPVFALLYISVNFTVTTQLQ